MPSLDNKQFLIGEKNTAVQQAVTALFKKLRLRKLRYAYDIQAAWETLKRGDIDLAVLDWALIAPGDFILVRRIRSDLRLVDLPILVMAGSPPADKVADAVRAGAGNFIVKPFTAETLLHKLENAFNTPPLCPVPAHDAMPGDPEAAAQSLIAKGRANLEAGRLDLAAKNFFKAVEIDEDAVEGYAGLADAAQRGRQPKEKVAGHLDAAVHAALRTDNMGRAEELYTRLMALYPGADNPFIAAAQQAMAMGEQRHGLRLLERAAALTPQDEGVVRALSETYAAMGEQDQALKVLADLMKDGDFPKAKELYVSLSGDEGFRGGEAGRMQILGEVIKKEGPNQRQAERKAFIDASVRPKGSDELYPVVDISTTGIGFKPLSGGFTAGQVVTFDLLSFGDVKVKRMQAAVRRVGEVVGCQFVDMSAAQTKGLFKLLGIKA